MSGHTTPLMMTWQPAASAAVVSPIVNECCHYADACPLRQLHNFVRFIRRGCLRSLRRRRFNACRCMLLIKNWRSSYGLCVVVDLNSPYSASVATRPQCSGIGGGRGRGSCFRTGDRGTARPRVLRVQRVVCAGVRTDALTVGRVLFYASVQSRSARRDRGMKVR